MDGHAKNQRALSVDTYRVPNSSKLGPKPKRPIRPDWLANLQEQIDPIASGAFHANRNSMVSQQMPTPSSHHAFHRSMDLHSTNHRLRHMPSARAVDSHLQHMFVTFRFSKEGTCWQLVVLGHCLLQLVTEFVWHLFQIGEVHQCMPIARHGIPAVHKAVQIIQRICMTADCQTVIVWQR